MPEQQGLFDSTRDVCASHHHGAPESVAAFETLVPQLPDLRRRVLSAVRHLGNATVKEVVEHTGIPRLTVGARLTELRQQGLLYKTASVRDGCRALAVSSHGEKAIQGAGQ